MKREKQRNSARGGQNRRVAIFSLSILVLLVGTTLWLMFVEPQPEVVKIEKELALETAH